MNSVLGMIVSGGMHWVLVSLLGISFDRVVVLDGVIFDVHLSIARLMDQRYVTHSIMHHATPLITRWILYYCSTSALLPSKEALHGGPHPSPSSWRMTNCPPGDRIVARITTVMFIIPRTRLCPPPNVSLSRLFPSTVPYLPSMVFKPDTCLQHRVCHRLNSLKFSRDGCGYHAHPAGTFKRRIHLVVWRSLAPAFRLADPRALALCRIPRTWNAEEETGMESDSLNAGKLGEP